MQSLFGTAQNWPYQYKDHPWSSHEWIKARLSNLPDGLRVLDVGAATGMLGQVCAGLSLDLFGLEPNAAWAEVARPYYRDLRCGTLESVEDAFLTGYDVVVMADVLEHMPDPERQLNRLVNLQREEAIFLISVPNVANLWVRLNLLLGRWEYAERGILDRTHLRFFTQRTFRDLLSTVNLRPRLEGVTPIPLDLVNPVFRRTAVGRTVFAALAWLTRVLPRLLGYQFLAEAVKAHVR